MANDLNLCQFIGRLGRDPETKYTPGGDAVTNFSIACGEQWNDKSSGEKQERTEWIRCIAWRKLGEICGEYLKKGSQVYVSGKMVTRKWKDKEGNERYSTEVVLDRMQMLGPKPSGGQEEAPRERPATAKKPATAGGFDDMDDDIPF